MSMPLLDVSSFGGNVGIPAPKFQDENLPVYDKISRCYL